MLITFLEQVSGTNFAFEAGATHDLPDEVAMGWINVGAAKSLRPIYTWDQIKNYKPQPMEMEKATLPDPDHETRQSVTFRIVVNGVEQTID